MQSSSVPTARSEGPDLPPTSNEHALPGLPFANGVVLLRQPRDGDAAAIAAHSRDPDIEETRWLPVGFRCSLQAARRLTKEFLKRLELRTDAHNAASQRVAAKAGFTRQGSVLTTVKTTGEEYEDVVFSLSMDQAP